MHLRDITNFTTCHGFFHPVQVFWESWEVVRLHRFPNRLELLEWRLTPRGWNGLMKKLRSVFLQNHEPIASDPNWANAQAQIDEAIASMVWPEGSPNFRINPNFEVVINSNGKPTKKRNGVSPIKEGFLSSLQAAGWKGEQKSVKRVGKVDVAWKSPSGTFAIEWETGNISSSHRSLNRLCLGLYNEDIVAGVLVLPSRALYRCLTDRVGNWQELEPYFEIYERMDIHQGVLMVIEVEHDELDPSIPLISQGTDGNSLVRRGYAPSDQ